MSYESVGTLREEKHQAKMIAKELCYERIYPGIITDISNASSITEVHRLLITAHHKM